MAAGSQAEQAHRQLCEWIQESPWLMQVLRTLREVAGPEAMLAAGVIRSLAWSRLHGEPVADWEASWRRSLPSVHGASGDTTPDLDVVLHDPCLPEGGEAALAQALTARWPVCRWEVVNQAWVHRWHRDGQGRPVPPVASLGEALATWPETATAVAAKLDASGHVQLLAPLGLQDLFALRLRHHPACTTRAQFMARVHGKGWLRRWPRLQVVPEEDEGEAASGAAGSGPEGPGGPAAGGDNATGSGR